MKCVQIHGDWEPKDGYDLTEQEREERFTYDGSQTWRNPRIDVSEASRPTVEDDQVLIEVKYAGICGSDLHMLSTDEDGYMNYSSFASLPNIPGHEFSGTVAATGSSVAQFESGDLVTSEVTQYCGSCDMCSRSRPFQCRDVDEIGFTIAGAHAEYIAVPEQSVWDISRMRQAFDSTRECLKAGALIEPYSIPFFGLFARANSTMPGANVAVYGGGPIGLAALDLARVCGASNLVLFEPKSSRRKYAERLGFDNVFDPTTERAEDRAMQLTSGEGMDVQIEAAGAPDATYPSMESLVAPGGDILHLGISDGTATFDPGTLQQNHAQVYGSEGHTGHGVFPRLVRMIATNRLDPRNIITDVYPLSDADRAYEHAAERREGKILIECN